MESVNVVFYNVMLPVLPPLRVYGQYERLSRVTEIIKKCEVLYDLDVVVLAEVIPTSIETDITNHMERIGYPYRTEPLQGFLSVKGGVLIFSKFELLDTRTITFGMNCSGKDCMSAKGVVYSNFIKNGYRYHIFATHLQSGAGISKHNVRNMQINMLQKFIKRMKIPVDEPVILCGDLNVDMYKDQTFFKYLLNQLNFNAPTLHNDSTLFTIDNKLNDLVGSDDIGSYSNTDYPNGCKEQYYSTTHCPCCPSEWIDYTLISNNHLRPAKSWMHCITAQVPRFTIPWLSGRTLETVNVSDHFPVVGHFEFVVEELRTYDKRHRITMVETDDNPNLSITTIIVISSVVIILLLAISYSR